MRAWRWTWGLFAIFTAAHVAGPVLPYAGAGALAALFLITLLGPADPARPVLQCGVGCLVLAAVLADLGPEGRAWPLDPVGPGLLGLAEVLLLSVAAIQFAVVLTGVAGRPSRRLGYLPVILLVLLVVGRLTVAVLLPADAGWTAYGPEGAMPWSGRGVIVMLVPAAAAVALAVAVGLSWTSGPGPRRLGIGLLPVLVLVAAAASAGAGWMTEWPAATSDSAPLASATPACLPEPSPALQGTEMSAGFEDAGPADQPFGPEERQAALTGAAALLLVGLAMVVGRAVPPPGPDWPAPPGGPRRSRR